MLSRSTVLFLEARIGGFDSLFTVLQEKKPGDKHKVLADLVWYVTTLVKDA